MMMKKLAFATLVAMGMTAAAIAQQPSSQQPTPRPAQPQTQQPIPQPAIPEPGSSQATPAPSGGDRTEQRQQSAQVTFETTDKNKDGKVTREEATGVPNLNFTSADVNADSSLSRQEFQTAMVGAQPRG